MLQTLEYDWSALSFTFPPRISRGVVRSRVQVLHAAVSDGAIKGSGEGCPLALFGDDPCRAKAETQKVNSSALFAHADPAVIQSPAVRNAIDCAVWDWHAKTKKTSVWEIAGVNAIADAFTSITLPLADLDTTLRDAERLSEWPILKLKLGSEQDSERLTAVRRVRPAATILVDVNGGWTEQRFREMLPVLEQAEVAVLEQPLPANADRCLSRGQYPFKVIADESFSSRASWEWIVEKYDGINVKLDKLGGLTSALTAVARAKSEGLFTVVGCMFGTGLSLAPAFVVAAQADLADLDNVTLLADDPNPTVSVRQGRISLLPDCSWGRLAS